MVSPFHGSQKTEPGYGYIHLALLPPKLPRLRRVEYQYPLKLVSPAPITVPGGESCIVHTVYLLTYGGGLVAGDCIDLHVEIEGGTRLSLLTQGSTKLFKSPSRDVISRQTTTVTIHPGGTLCYLPDPVQPFEHSCFEQRQIYKLQCTADDSASGSLCVLDWVSNGRSANGEDWSFYRYTSRNEIHLHKHDGQPILLLRDNIVLDDHGIDKALTSRMHGMAVTGTLIISGAIFKSLADFFLAEFSQHPRVGGRTWDDDGNTPAKEPQEMWRAKRQQGESEVGLLWSVASIRGCAVIKFCAHELEHARHWLRDMLQTENTVPSAFGERALLCL